MQTWRKQNYFHCTCEQKKVRIRRYVVLFFFQTYRLINLSNAIFGTRGMAQTHLYITTPLPYHYHQDGSFVVILRTIQFEPLVLTVH